MHKFYISILLVAGNACLLFSQRDSLLEKGLANQKAGKHELAIADFSEAIKRHASEVAAYVKKWDELQKFSEFERAEKGLELPPIDVAFAGSYYLRGISQAAMKNTDAATDDFTTALKINPKYSRAYCERGKLLWTLGKKYEGCYDLRTARNLGDTLAKELFDEKFCWNEAVLFHKEAVSKLKLNQYDVALELIQKSILLSPDSVLYLVVRAKCYSGLGKLDLALPDFDKAISTLPKNMDAHFGRGLAYYTKRKYQEAFDDFDNAVRINERFADGYLYRAYACEGLNKVQSALYDYAQVQRLKPNDALAYYKSGLLKNESGDSKGACIDFRKAASLGNTEAGDYAKSCK